MQEPVGLRLNNGHDKDLLLMMQSDPEMYMGKGRHVTCILNHKTVRNKCKIMVLLLIFYVHETYTFTKLLP